MAQPVIQTSFHAGEWAPALNARVDLAKYHSAAALLRNFFVDYRGGASTRAGTKYILRCFKSSTPVRLIGFQASFTVSYVLEFGDNYIRFFSNGAPVLKAAVAINSALQSNPVQVGTLTPHNLSVGDWVFIKDMQGMTQLNGKYFIVRTVNNPSSISLNDLFGNAVDGTAFGLYTTGGTLAAVYTLPSPYLASDLAGLKFAGNINTMILCHPSYPPNILTLIAANNWTISPIVFGTTVATPTGLSISTTAGGIMNYSYLLTAVDSKGQESATSTIVSSTVTNAAGNQSITVGWGAVSGASSYNIYRAGPAASSAVPTGAAFGFVANVTGVSFIDCFTNGIPIFSADFSETIPIAKNPFQGAGVASVAITAPGAYTGTVPTVTFGAAPSGGTTATGTAVAQIQGTPTISNGAAGNLVGDILDGQFVTCSVVVATVDGGGGILTLQPITFPGSVPGSLLSGTAIPGNPVPFINRRNNAIHPTVNLTWGIGSVQLIQAGAGYTSAPAVTFSSGAATATATLDTAAAGNPSVPIFFDQRLTLMGPRQNPHQFNMSQPSAFFNYNVSNPVQPDDAIQGTLVAQKLNSIQSGTVMSAGLIVLTDQQAWLVNGGAAGAPPTPIDIAANGQAYNGSSALPPIVANLDILYVQAKGSIVRDLTFNFYTNIYTGADISILSSHLFYGFTLTEWAYAEEPFKVVWAVRNDGQLLALTFVKEQELIGWAHSDTDGLFKSICAVTETVSFGSVDAIYTVVERTINGQTVKYVERMAERIFPNGVSDAWCVDAGLSYSGGATTLLSGLEHLVGKTVTGVVASGAVIPPTVVSVAGTITVNPATTKAIVGLPFTAQLKTLQIDLGQPTVQSKRKKIVNVSLRCQETLGLSIGKTFSDVVPMKDLVVGNLGSQTDELVTTAMVTGDAMTVIPPKWDVPGQYCIQQSNPYPATILGVIPDIVVGDN